MTYASCSTRLALTCTRSSHGIRTVIGNYNCGNWLGHILGSLNTVLYCNGAFGVRTGRSRLNYGRRLWVLARPYQNSTLITTDLKSIDSINVLGLQLREWRRSMLLWPVRDLGPIPTMYEWGSPSAFTV